MEEAIQVILESDGENPFRAMLEFMAQQVLEYEMGEHVGAAPYERTRERVGYRNGYKTRTLTTAVGDLILLVPQDRDGTFKTSIFERYQRSDKALVLALMEMYLKGASTRKVADINREALRQVLFLPAGLQAGAGARPHNRPVAGEAPYRFLPLPHRGRTLREGAFRRKGGLHGDPLRAGDR
ncbi:MAG: transposase [Planctomycetes bacterium]|nr:transposase [Planctomycetota bacterium]